MANFVPLRCEGLEPLRSVNPMLVSYNVEMTEVTGGTFWKAYTEAQIDGTEEFPAFWIGPTWAICSSGTIRSIRPTPD